VAEESQFVGVAESVAKDILRPPLFVRRGAALLYEITINNRLDLTVDPKRPVRGDAAFQTDLCIFEKKAEDISIPRVVLEFKTKITTHDVLTYSAKASKHKQVYPYLRYGIVASEMEAVPRRFFVHNESLDFFAALAGIRNGALRDFLTRLISAEVKDSECLENIAFGSLRTRMYRSEIHVDAA
jgi:hypothetical protein